VFGQPGQRRASCPTRTAPAGTAQVVIVNLQFHPLRAGVVRHPDYVVLPAGTAWRTDPADAAALRIL
jgi:hypothetical protein